VSRCQHNATGLEARDRWLSQPGDQGYTKFTFVAIVTLSDLVELARYRTLGLALRTGSGVGENTIMG
jgi:hypothetical protein